MVISSVEPIEEGPNVVYNILGLDRFALQHFLGVCYRPFSATYTIFPSSVYGDDDDARSWNESGMVWHQVSSNPRTESVNGQSWGAGVLNRQINTII